MSPLLSAALFVLGTASAAPQDTLQFTAETYQLENGTTVTLHVDHSLPKVLINTWFAVGSKDESVGRTGFAHLFEHLMFMGTERVPGSQFDILMESGGGSNNASTSNDRTNYYSMGPSSLLPTLLWLDADRLDALAANMTQDKLDKQRAVVRNERRQTSENVPYGKARLILPGYLYPEGHPYHHTVIGSHEDLEAATVKDVTDFFHKFYVPSNASLVVAGDFDPALVKPLIESTFGAVPAKPIPAHKTADPVVMHHEKRVVSTDQVQFPRLYLVWHSPAYYSEGDGEMDLVGSILTGGPSTRLQKRLVNELELAQDVAAYQASGELGSTFQIFATAREGVSLDAIKTEILNVLEELKREGPTEAEMARVKVQMEASFRGRTEGLQSRADSMNAYLHFFGEADGFQRDLDRWLKPSAANVTSWASKVFTEGRVDLRVMPDSFASALDTRPEDFAPTKVELFKPETFKLSNGIEVVAVSKPGKQLFSGRLLIKGGESLVSADKAGTSALLARMLDSGAGGLDTAAFADAVESLGASVGTRASQEHLTISVSGLSSKLDETLDRFSDVALRANLNEEDFAREKALTLASIESRKDNPQAVSSLITQQTTYGAEDPRGRPTSGHLETVNGLDLSVLAQMRSVLLHPANASMVFVGDFDVEQLQRSLESRFGTWGSSLEPTSVKLEPLTAPALGRIVLFDRPGAPQTIISLSRPVAPASGVARAARECVDTVLGGSFTSRLNSNLRERNGYTYGARSRVGQIGEQFTFVAGAAVRTDVTGASLQEFKKELEAMGATGISEVELGKAVATRKIRLVSTAETTSGLAGSLSGLMTNGRALTALSDDLNALAKVSLEDTKAVCDSGLYDWNKLLIVLVGDKEKVLSQLAEAGFPEPTIVE